MSIPVGYGQANVVWTTPWDTEVRASFGFVTVSGEDALGMALIMRDALKHVSGGAVVGPAYPDHTLAGFTWDRVDTTIRTTLGLFSGSASVSVNGTLSNDSRVAPNTTLLLRKFTGLGNRHGRGRCYPPVYYPQATRISSAGSLNADDTDELTTRWEVFRTQVEAATSMLVILHPVGTGSDITPTPIQELRMESKLATQRRRLR